MANGKCTLGLVGLGVMGQNLLLNIADHGFAVAAYNRTTEKTREFIRQVTAGQDVRPAYTLREFADLLEPPRVVLIMVKAGKAVDSVLEELKAVLEPGDLVIDCGNSFFRDTDRRAEELPKAGLHFFGMGISGGESGARFGPSMMPGGPEKEYERVRPVLEAAAAKVDGVPCVAHLGPRSAGHYVKMVHNGIEYGVMQILAESYDLLKRGPGLGNKALADVYGKWNKGKLNSFLVEITADVFRKKDDLTDQYLIDVILDRARQKGTGEWTSSEAMKLQVPTPTIDAAVVTRNMSLLKDERVRAEQTLKIPKAPFHVRDEAFVRNLEQAVLCGMILTYAQGMALLRQASETYGYGLNLEQVAKIWRGGCIIRSALLEDIRKAYLNDAALPNLLLDPDLGGMVCDSQANLRDAVKAAVDMSIFVPGLSSALAYLDGYRIGRMPMNLVQAQRDYFGSHTYERIDREGTFHTQWTEE